MVKAVKNSLSFALRNVLFELIDDSFMKYGTKW